MKNWKYRRTGWYPVLLLGIVGTLVSLSLLVADLVKNGFVLLSFTACLCATACCGALIYYALRAMGRTGDAAPLPTEKKARVQAEQTLADGRKRLDSLFSRSLSAAILFICALIFLWAYGEARTTPSIPQSTVLTGIVYEKATVLSIDSEFYQGQQDMEDIPIGNQVLTVEITSGDYAGKHYQVKNNLSYLYGTILEVGDPITVSLAFENGEIYEVLLQDYDRTLPLLFVIAFFLISTIFVGGKIGAKSLLGLGLTILCVFAVLIPMLLGGWPTLPTILGVCAFVTVVEFTILGGIDRKIVCAILGTISGVVFAALFGQLACYLLRVNGFLMYTAEPTIEALLQLKQGQDPATSLQIGDLLVGGILIAALGAVNDVAMSISSSMNELITVNPNLTRRDLFRSGMNIGRDMVGTMTNTLILALVGSGLVLMIYLSSLEPSFTQLMSTTFLSVEMVQAIASSVGVIWAVPMSVVIGMILFGKKKAKA